VGRNATGATTTGESLQLSISGLIKKKDFIKGKIYSGKITWGNGANIGFKLSLLPEDYELEIFYTHTDWDGSKTDIKYKIQIVGIPSNLGKGENLYFLCPFSFKKCKTLYKCYGSHYFKHREAYKHRIYYKTQIRSKLDRYNYRYWDLDERIQRLEENEKKSHYRGNKTKLQQQISELKETRDYYDEMRWTVLPVALQKMLPGGF
jgi:hypothetical protein